MRVVVLGGAGEMGAEAVRDLANNPEVEMITIADLNTKAAENLAHSYGHGKARVVKVDATIKEELVSVLVGHHVAAGALGPFYQFEKTIVEAAIQAGVDYVSICDDHDAAKAIFSLDEQAQEKGRKILTGLGWAPGISNILARKGYDQLDQASAIKIYWAGSAGEAVGLAVLLHTIHIFSGEVSSFQAGKETTVPAGSGREVIEFPPPLGQVTVFHLGHPEPITIPRHLNGLQEVSLKGGLIENYLNKTALFLNRLKLTNTPRKKQILAELMKTFLPILPVSKKRSRSGILVEVLGEKDGKPVKVTLAAVDNMRRLTGIPLSIGTYMMGRGEIKRYGVFSPEADDAVNPDRFLEELSHRGINVIEKAE